MLNASPEDIRRFLIYKEENGRTQLHKNDCVFKNNVGLHKCGCPRTLAAISVDSLIGKNRAIFRDEGRAGDLNPMLFTRNPGASPLMKRHLQSVTSEQQNANTVMRQAVPMMFDNIDYRLFFIISTTSANIFLWSLIFFTLLFLWFFPHMGLFINF